MFVQHFGCTRGTVKYKQQARTRSLSAAIQSRSKDSSIVEEELTPSDPYGRTYEFKEIIPKRIKAAFGWFGACPHERDAHQR